MERVEILILLAIGVILALAIPAFCLHRHGYLAKLIDMRWYDQGDSQLSGNSRKTARVDPSDVKLSASRGSPVSKKHGSRISTSSSEGATAQAEAQQLDQNSDKAAFVTQRRVKSSVISKKSSVQNHKEMVTLLQVIKYFQGVAIIGGFAGMMDLPELNLWFFQIPDVFFIFSFDISALECILGGEHSAFTSAMVSNWFGFWALLLCCGGVMAMVNLFVCISNINTKSDQDTRTKSDQEGARISYVSQASSITDGSNISNNVNNSEPVAANKASKAGRKTDLLTYLRLRTFAILTGKLLFLFFPTISRNMLSFYDCVEHPAATGGAAHRTHRIFRDVVCDQWKTQNLVLTG